MRFLSGPAPVMQVVFERGVIFKRIIDAIKDLSKETNIEISENCIDIQAMDSSHVSLIELNVKNSVKITLDRQQVIAVNFESVAKILRIMELETPLFISTHKNRLLFQSGEVQKSEFSTPLMDVEMARHDVPEFDYPNKITLNSGEFTKICSNLKEFGSDITIQLKNSEVRFIVNGDEANGSLCLSETNTKINIGVELEQTFAVKHLVAFTKAAPLSDCVDLELGEDFPLRVTFSFQNEDYIRYYLAPKIDE
tara:strand:- start:1002 stop:1757 length:756 start_codon:yes stop_codon:yes gene_type:complete